MRAVFFSLLAINLGLFVWGQMPSSKRADHHVQRHQEANFVGIPSFKLLGEMDSLEPVEDVNEQKPRTQIAALGNDGSPGTRETSSIRETSDTSLDDKAMCEMVGAFRNKAEVASIIARLESIGANARRKEMVQPAGPGYWVYLQPSSSRQEALAKLRELQSKGIDSYVIPKGDLANAISLGMFTQKSLSELRLKEMKNVGLDPKLAVIERTYREFWVMLEQGEESKVSKNIWSRVLKGFESVKRRQNFCLDVAS